MSKKITAGILALAMAVSLCTVSFPAQANAAVMDNERIIVVSDVEELIGGIDDDVTLVLEPGIYNLTEYLESLKSPKLWQYDKSQGQGCYVEEVYDGLGLVMSGYQGLSIISASSEAPATIVCEPRYADVLSFVDCDDILLDDLILGHTPEQGYCAGEVLSFEECEDIRIHACEMYGCGTYGLSLYDCEAFDVTDCEVHDCTYGCAVLSGSREVRFIHTSFHDCREFTMFETWGSTVDFIGCDFRRLEGEFLSGDTNRVNFTACSYDSDIEKELVSLGVIAREKSPKQNDVTAGGENPEQTVVTTGREEDLKQDRSKSEPVNSDQSGTELEDLDWEAVSSSELKKLGKELTEDYNGFFASTYTRPEEISWDQVFYTGAGFALDPFGKDSRLLDEYLSLFDEDYELITDVTMVAEKDVEKYVKETTGLSYDEMWEPLSWTYLYESGVYASEHGDTNYMPYEFKTGQKADNVYRLTYDTYDYLFRDREYTATIEKVDGGYHFISNVPSDWTGEEAVSGFYGSILRTYLSVLQWEPVEEELWRNGLPSELLSLFELDEWEQGPGAVYNKIGYAFTDLDGDRADELVLVQLADKEALKDTPDYIYQIFSSEEGRPQLVYEMLYDGETVLLADGTVAETYAYPSEEYAGKDILALEAEDKSWRIEESCYTTASEDKGESQFFTFAGYDTYGEPIYEETTQRKYNEFVSGEDEVFTEYTSLDQAETEGYLDRKQRLYYFGTLGKPDASSSWIDGEEYVDAYLCDNAVSIWLGRFALPEDTNASEATGALSAPELAQGGSNAPKQTAEDLNRSEQAQGRSTRETEQTTDQGEFSAEEFLEEKLGVKPKKVTVDEISAQDLFDGFDFEGTGYEVNYQTGANEDLTDNRDQIFIDKEAVYWLHTAIPADLSGEYKVVWPAIHDALFFGYLPTYDFLGELAGEELAAG